MRDFTLDTFRQLLSTLIEQEYTFRTFAGFLKNPASKFIILRHDVDARKMNSLSCARLEKELGITGTYNFRMVSESFDENVIKEIFNLGHEIGYHYEDFVTARGNYDLAIRLFEENLAKLRRVAPVETICMHGSPLSKYDNRKLWGKYNYRDYGIIGEPYFDINFNEVLYLTDTGRRWDGESVNIRDKSINHKGHKGSAKSTKNEISPSPPFSFSPFHKLHSTFDIINFAKRKSLPDKIMLTIHPQRWDNRLLPWIKELVWQNIKNVGKRLISYK
jgi:hypothetical protein